MEPQTIAGIYLVAVLPAGMSCVLVWVCNRGSLPWYIAAATPYLAGGFIGWINRPILSVGVQGWCLPLAAVCITLICSVRLNRWWRRTLQVCVAWLAACICIWFAARPISVL